MSVYSYESILESSERVNWRVEDLIGNGKRLDFTRPFLPESLARTGELEMLTPEQRLTLNHVRGHNYLYLFGLVEEFILPFIVDHARTCLTGNDAKTRALLAFAGEEAKHIQLFKSFRREFVRDFGHDIDVIGPAAAIAEEVLAHEPLSVGLTILHIEWMTQRHWVECAQIDQGLDPQFKSLLRHHWMEEAQHAKIDANIVALLGEDLDEAAIANVVDGYLEIGMLLDGGLAQQVEFDIDALERACSIKFSADDRARLTERQHQAMRWTFLGTGMTHPKFLQSLGSLSEVQKERIQEVAPTFS